MREGVACCTTRLGNPVCHKAILNCMRGQQVRRAVHQNPRDHPGMRSRKPDMTGILGNGSPHGHNDATHTSSWPVYFAAAEQRLLVPVVAWCCHGSPLARIAVVEALHVWLRW
jgi:hypothetical protein